MNKLKTIELNPTQKPIASVIWLHGLGATNDDFVPVAQALNLPNDLPVRFIFPQAPNRPVTINNHWIMPAWYDIKSLTSSGREEDKSGLLESNQLLIELIETEMARGIPASAIYLAGFSQGGALALYTALHYPERLGGLICLSAYLPIADEFAQNLSENNRQLAIFLGHGTNDEILSFAIGDMLRHFLVNETYSVNWKSYVMGHEVCLDEINDIAIWFKQLLIKAKSTS